MEGLVVPFQELAQGIVNLGNGFLDILNYLNPFSENFILKTIIEFLGNILSYINPFDENFLGRKLIELLSNLLNDLFVPTEDHFGELHNKFSEKFGFIEQIKELAIDLFSFNSEPVAISEEGNYPSWDITYQGVTVSIIDFSVFDQYRGVVHGIIISVLYVAYFLRLFRRLPGIIGGFYVENEGNKG